MKEIEALADTITLRCGDCGSLYFANEENDPCPYCTPANKQPEKIECPAQYPQEFPER